ncbi:DUF7344 domain-containing protein [Halorientalis halophila]|uniref:DUF7344 domain-containing protein n=1 Tax=Halorientalis halophila TaxID=3108499 RepID=UPI0030080D9F
MGVLSRERTVSDEEIHDILRNSRRRAVLELLRESVGSMSVRELSVSVAESEAGESPPPTNLRQSVYNSLHQTHLPKLDREGIVVYDSDRKTVRLDDPASEVDLYMEVITPYGITWAGYYRTLTTVALLALLAAELEVALLGAIGALPLLILFLLVLGASTTYQLWSRRWVVLRALAD